MIENIEGATYDLDSEGRAILQVMFDGREATILPEQKLLRSFGMVFLGPEFADDKRFHLVVPADEREGRLTPRVAQGFTNDTRIVGLVRQMLRDIENDRFQPGRAKIP